MQTVRSMETLSLLPFFFFFFFTKAVSVDLKQTTFGKCQVMILVKYKILKGTQNKRQEVLNLRGQNTGIPNAIVTTVTGKGQSGCSGRMPKGAVLRNQ